MPGQVNFDQCIGSEQSRSANRRLRGRSLEVFLPDFVKIIEVSQIPQEDLNLKDFGRSIGAYASGHVICRRTAKETNEYYHYIVDEMGDWAAADQMADIRCGRQSVPAERLQHTKARLISDRGALPMIGDPDAVAAKFKFLSGTGLDGMSFNLVNYVDDFPFFRAKLVPRLERLGLRGGVQAAA